MCIHVNGVYMYLTTAWPCITADFTVKLQYQ